MFHIEFILLLLLLFNLLIAAAPVAMILALAEMAIYHRDWSAHQWMANWFTLEPWPFVCCIVVMSTGQKNINNLLPIQLILFQVEEVESRGYLKLELIFPLTIQWPVFVCLLDRGLWVWGHSTLINRSHNCSSSYERAEPEQKVEHANCAGSIWHSNRLIRFDQLTLGWAAVVANGQLDG